MPTIFAHIVTYNSSRYVGKCIESLLGQASVKVEVSVTDNSSSDRTRAVLESFSDRIHVNYNGSNLGFCEAHNQGVRKFHESNADYLLILNPDVKLAPNFLVEAIKGFTGDKSIGLVTPKLFRADDNLEPVDPRSLDAAGMVVTNALRHFDRGSNELDIGRYDNPTYVFGGTGAALLIKRACVEDLLLRSFEPPQLFDEAFFAYREDADLAWRSIRYGWRCMYVSSAIGFHRRMVLPENRAILPPELNRYSVRNRFLLQLNNFSFIANWKAIVNGFMIRNLLVIGGVIFREWGSLSGLVDLLRLFPRAMKVRREVFAKRRVSNMEIGRWFI